MRMRPSRNRDSRTSAYGEQLARAGHLTPVLASDTLSRLRMYGEEVAQPSPATPPVSNEGRMVGTPDAPRPGKGLLGQAWVGTSF